MEGSIADFAESLILGDISNVKEGKSLPPALRSSKPDPHVPDLRNTQVPDAMMSEILGEQYVPDHPEEVIEEEEEIEEEFEQEYIPENFITESQASEMIDLLYEVRGLLREMTTTGSMGVNLSSKRTKSQPVEDEDDYGYRKPTAASIVLQNLRKRRRK